MAIKDSYPFKILSLLNGALEERLCRRLPGGDICRYQKIDLPGWPPQPDEIIDSSIWSSLPLDDVDLILLPLTHGDLDRLSRIITPGSTSGDWTAGLWTWPPAAIVAVLVDDSLHDAVLAAQLDFDGILVEPFLTEQIMSILHNSIKRKRRRCFIAQRYCKVRQLFRKVNRNRRLLRDKIDLLCRDLVQSNTNFINTLQNLHRVYDFQSDLIGEFDLRYLLHKALRRIKEQVPDSSAVIYLCRSNDVEAHISGPWYDDQRDLAEIEDLLKQTIIAKVLVSGRDIMVPDAGSEQEFSPDQRRLLAGLSLMALPIFLDDELFGVSVIYRNLEKPLNDADQDSVKPYLLPLAHSIAAIHKLQHLITN